MSDRAPKPTPRSDESKAAPATSRAAFLGGLLAFLALVALSVIGVGHARTISGSANAQFWIVVALTAAALGFVTIALARTPARTKGGDAVRRVAVALGLLWLAIFLWETVAVGTGAAPAPFELVWSALKG